VLDTIEAHARRGHPYEVCGVLLGRTGSGIVVEDAIAVENREEDLPRVRYRIAPEDLLAIQAEARRGGRDIVGFYHSHPDHPARPSETDRRIAAEGLSDGVAHVVVGVTAAGRTEATGWVFRDALAAFESETIETGSTHLQEEEQWRSGS
jgi:proteasome lid subunit RPN8/RPN11